VVTLLLIDVINPLDFDGGENLLRYALPAARRLAALKQRLAAIGVESVYVNDNFGSWHLSFRELIERLRNSDHCGQPLAEILAPEPCDHFVLKPKHSGFYGTSLQLLLEHLGSRRLIMGGFAGNICVLFTANDAYMRGYEIVVPADCVACETKSDNDTTLRQMQHVLKADTRPSVAIEKELVGRRARVTHRAS